VKNVLAMLLCKQDTSECTTNPQDVEEKWEMRRLRNDFTMMNKDGVSLFLVIINAVAAALL
jgi:hypothetical protein